MIITRTPLRISLCSSGGSDLPAFYQHGIPGMALTAAINRYMYISVNPKFDGKWRLCYSKTEETNSLDQLEHDLARESIIISGIQDALEIHSCCDVPAGTGLGSSSAYTVGLIHALRVYHQRLIDQDRLAHLACRVEIERCGHPIGKQDQYACALGGVRLLKFEASDDVASSPLTHPRLLDDLHQHLLLLWTGRTRDANEILKDQSERMRSEEYREKVFQIAGRTVSFARALSESNWEACGEILDESWQLKRDLSGGITDPQIDDWYDQAREAGGLGGKLCGAGGGGFLLVLAPPDRHNAIQVATGLDALQFDFDFSGSSVVYSSGK